MSSNEHPDLQRRALLVSMLGALAMPTAYARLGEQSELTLFDAAPLGDLMLANRIVMAPLTRGRAGESRTPNPLMAEYYAQRSSAGLIITEGTAISEQAYGWGGSPGIYTQAHVEGWKQITDAAHRKGGRIFLQLWHTGRVSHPYFQNGETPIGPSAIAANGDAYTPSGKEPYVTPRAMTQQDIDATVEEYARATELAKEAGFDGVEIHAANGYLIDQFIRDGSNQRTDAYGGSTENRLRFLLEVTDAVVGAWSAERVGVRLSPTNAFNDMSDSNPDATFTAAAAELNKYGLAYLHVLDEDNADRGPDRTALNMRKIYTGTYMLNQNYDFRSGTDAIQAGHADLISYGRHYISNPDLVERFRDGMPLSPLDPSTLYQGGAEGYTDYPVATP
ncbi:MAG: alkene reductase [Pseudomonadota bacterium]